MSKTCDWAWPLAVVLGLGGLAASCGRSSTPTSISTQVVNLRISLAVPGAPSGATKLLVADEIAAIAVNAASLNAVPYQSSISLTRDESGTFAGTLTAVPVGARLQVTAIALDESQGVLASGTQIADIAATTTLIPIELVEVSPSPTPAPGETVAIALSGSVVNANTGEPVANVQLDLANTLMGTTDSEGTYVLAGAVPLSALVDGSFVLTATPDSETGCSPQTVIAANSVEEQVIQIALECPDAAIEIALSGSIVNANTGEPLANVQLDLANTLTGTTDSEGNYTLAGIVPFSALVDGAFVLTATPDIETGCSVQTQAVANSADEQTVNINLNCSDTGEPIITLGWGVNPADLDAHLLSPKGERVSFLNPEMSFASLDIDDVSSSGPETITVSPSNASDGTYVYCVHWFSGEESDRDEDLPARVTFAGAGFEDRTITRFFDFEGITSGPGGVWAVASFDIVNNSITQFTELDLEASPAEADAVCNDVIAN